MSAIVTLELPDALVQSARAIATQRNRRVEDILVEWLDQAASEVPVELLPDEQVVLLGALEMDKADQAKLSDLLARQREGSLADADRPALDALMGTYRRGLVRKAQALKVAVDRGLRPPLSAA
ncbi:MAG TPA: hypothetical protein PKD53_03120 [Chloroflexaceae bacterium]|nr:hypothetical protein [Chloroflexaceae bacterium]